MHDDHLNIDVDVASVSDDVLRELTRRVQDIDDSYRAVAEKMGQLYLCAGGHELESLTRSLDRQMRNVSEDEQTFATILDELRLQAQQRR